MFSGFFARSGDAAARLRSDGSARSGALATGRSTRGDTIMYCSGGSARAWTATGTRVQQPKPSRNQQDQITITRWG